MSTRQTPYSIDAPTLHDQALQALTAADVALAHAPALALTAPHTLAEITPEWLGATLGAGTPGAALEALVAVDAHDGMTSRKKWALHWNAAGQQAGLPSAVFVKATPDTPHHRETLAVLHMHELEAKFYQQIQPELPTLAPSAYYAQSYPGGRFMIVLADLADTQSRPFWLADDCDIAHARAVAVALAQLHAPYWQSERLLGDLAWVRPRTKRFGWHWLSQSFTQGRTAFLQRAAEQELPSAAVDLLRLWNQHAEAVFQHWEHHPHTVLHGDCHLGNTFARADGRAGLFDWQVMFSGHGLRDLAYFVHSSLNNEQRREHQQTLFELYLDTLAEGGVRLDRQTAWNDYCLYTLDQWDASIVTFLHGSYGHAAHAIHRNLQTCVGSLLDNDTADRLAHLIRHQLR